MVRPFIIFVYEALRRRKVDYIAVLSCLDNNDIDICVIFQNNRM